MVTAGVIEQFYKDVAALGLKFPVAAITKATGESKGNVSRILNKHMDPSEGFLARFYEGFKDVPRATVEIFNNVTSGEPTGIIDGGILMTMYNKANEERIKALEKHNDFLQRLVETNLNQTYNLVQS